MKVDNIKIELIQWLAQLEDKQVLQSLFYFKNIQEKTDWWDMLTDAQLKEVEKSIEAVKKGKTIPNKNVWLKYGRAPKH